MNLRAIANSVTQFVNPNIFAQLWASNGYTVGTNFKRVPAYTRSTIQIQLQMMTDDDLRQLDSLNIQGIHRKVYCNPQVLAIIRVAAKGGDMLVFPPGTIPEGTTWLCTHVLERWPNWCTFAITLQNDNLSPVAPFP